MRNLAITLHAYFCRVNKQLLRSLNTNYLKFKFSLSLCYLMLTSLMTLVMVTGNWQPAQAKPVDDSKIQLNGQVMDEKGLPVQGATIKILNGHSGAVSESDGQFQLMVPKDSSCTISVEAIGYQPTTKILRPYQQKDQLIKIELIASLNDLEDVSVSAVRRSSGSLDLVYAHQKAASAISDGISQDIIKKSPDRNMGDVLKRISGASVQDDKFVIIRGLNERYNTAKMNGALLPSTEPDKKAFAFNIIPASLIDQVLIYKSMTPDLPADFAGGAIDITTKDFPNKRVSELSLSLGYQGNTTFRAFKKSTVTGKYDFTGYFDERRSLPAAYNHYKSDFSHQDDGIKMAVTEKFSNNFGFKKTANSLPDISIAYTGGDTRYTSSDKKFGYIYSLGYSASREVLTGSIKDYSIDKREIYNSSSTQYAYKYAHYALLNLSYAFNSRNRLLFKNIYNNQLTSELTQRAGANLSNEMPQPFISSASKANRDGLVQSVLQGIHDFKTNQQLNWNLSYARTYHYSPDETILTLNENALGGYERKLSNENSPAIQNAGRVYSSNLEQQFGGSLDYSYNFKMGDRSQLIKAGMNTYYRKKDVIVEALGYATLNAYGTTLPADPSDPYNLFTKENIEAYKVTVATIGNNSTDYLGKAWNTNGFIMLENKWLDNWTLKWGAKLSHYNQQLIPTSGKVIEKNNTDILPSAILTYRPGVKMNLRLAGSQSVNRPEFRELADYSLYDYSKDFIYRGNPNLTRSKITNLDFRYEFFPGAGEILSASVFYKHFKDPIEQINQGNGILNYQNADNAQLYGAEIEIRKKLDFLGNPFFNKWTFYGNATYVDGDIQLSGAKGKSLMQGQSPYLIGAGLSYTQGDLAFNLLYQKAGPRLAFRGQGDGQLNIYEKGRDVMDAQISYRLLKSKKLELKLSVKDLLAQSQDWYYKFDASTGNAGTGYNPKTDKITRQFNPARAFNLSIKYQF